MVPSHQMILLVQASDLLPGILPKHETSCIIQRALGPIHSILVDLLPENMVARVIRDGLRRHGRQVVVEERGIVGFLVEATQKEVLTTKPSNNPSLI